MAQLDSLTATGQPIQPQELKRLWSDVDVSVTRTPADGPWDGLELVQVTAAAQRVTVRLARYAPPQPVKVVEGGQH
jgi:hypothetical protein